MAAAVSSFLVGLGSPKTVVAPMVNQSDLPFRLLCRRHGAQLAYTQMFNSKSFAVSANYRKSMFQSVPEDRPLFVQFCGDNPQVLLAAAKHVENLCDAVDINFGCPQGIAKKGHYGAFLLEEPELVVDIISTLSKGLSIPVTCKIRILPTIEATLSLVRAIQAAGAALITVHGRTRQEMKQFIGPCNWEAIRIIKSELSIPVFANGGISSASDVAKCLEYTGVDGVMSSEAILENPALFEGGTTTPRELDALAMEYLDLCKIHRTDSNTMKAHLHKILYTGLHVHTDIRDIMVRATTVDELIAVVNELSTRRSFEYGLVDDDDVRPRSLSLNWYHRHLTHNLEAVRATSHRKVGGGRSIDDEDGDDGDDVGGPATAAAAAAANDGEGIGTGGTAAECASPSSAAVCGTLWGSLGKAGYSPALVGGHSPLSPKGDTSSWGSGGGEPVTTHSGGQPPASPRGLQPTHVRYNHRRAATPPGGPDGDLVGDASGFGSIFGDV